MRQPVTRCPSPVTAGEGLLATRRFKSGETVVVGEIERRLPGNHSHATQVGIGQYVLLGGSDPRSIIPATRTAVCV